MYFQFIREEKKLVKIALSSNFWQKRHCLNIRYKIYTCQLSILLDLMREFNFLHAVYSCTEKGCPTKAYATMPKDIMGNGSLCSSIDALGVSTT